MFEKLVEIIVEQLGCDASEITQDTSIIEDLGADSLDVVEMLMAVEDSFGITVPDEEIPNLRTIRDFIAYVEANS